MSALTGVGPLLSTFFQDTVDLTEWIRAVIDGNRENHGFLIPLFLLLFEPLFKNLYLFEKFRIAGITSLLLHLHKEIFHL